MSTLPRVVVVGRMNVGKSTLFNRLSESVKSISLDYEGVTRDFISDTVEWQDKQFELIDTGGVILKKTTDPLLAEVRSQVIALIDTADLVLFVCDATVGLLPEDRDIARILYRGGKKVLLVINKVDSRRGQEQEYEFQALGYDNVCAISAEHGTGIADLLEKILELLPAKGTGREPISEPKYRVVLLGKPNVGKSSLMNLLLDKERTIVSDVAGTTREAISEQVAFYQEDLQITDTPGLRRKKSVKEPVETLMVKSSFRALERADVVLLLVDAASGLLSDQELKLAFYAFAEKYKALIILFNKQDLTTDTSAYQLEFALDEYRYLMKKIETLNISCKTKKNVGKVLPLVKKVWGRYSQTLPEEEVNRLLLEALERKPLYHKKNLLKVFRVYQVAHAPITLLLAVNHPDWFGPSQLAFFEGIVRRNFDVRGVPIRFVTRKRK